MLRAVQVVVDEGLAQPILVGRPGGARARIERFGLRIEAGHRFRGDQSRVRPALQELLDRVLPAHARARACRRQYAQIEMRRRHTLIGAMTVHMGDADGMLCGTFGTPPRCTCEFVDQVIGLRQGAKHLRGDERGAAAEPHGVHRRHLRQRRPDGRGDRRDRAPRRRGDPALRHRRRRWRCCRIRASAAAAIRRRRRCSRRWRSSTRIDPDLEVDGEMHGDAALSESVRQRSAARTRG